MRGAASRDKFSYELTTQRFNNRTEDALEAGFDYLPRSGSSFGLVARRVKGKYQFDRFDGQAFLNESFEQDELKARINWKVTGITTLQALAGHVRRKNASYGPENLSGFNGRVILLMNPRVKLRLTSQAWREFLPIESNIVSFGLNRGASINAAYDASAKVRIDGLLSTERRAFEARETISTRKGLSDSLKQAQLSATWSPRPTIQLSTAYSHHRRSGAAFLGNGSFKANTVSVNANAQF